MHHRLGPPLGRLHPQILGFDDGDRGERNLKRCTGKAHDGIEAFFGRGAHHSERLHRTETLDFVTR